MDLKLALSDDFAYFFDKMDKLECRHKILLYDHSDFYKGGKVELERKYYICKSCNKKVSIEIRLK